VKNIILSEVSQAQKVRIACTPSYANYRPKTNAVILLDTGHTRRGEHTQEGQENRKKTKNLNVVDVLTV
jgi:hypothetical protein